MAQKGESDTEDREGSQAGLIRLAAILGLTAVGCGAMGAHAIKALGPESLDWWNTGARYHLAHGLAVGLVAVMPVTRKGLIAGLFTAGVVLFSGSLYLLAVTGTRALGMVTPFGGLAFMGGWVVLALNVRK
ncbi:MAG: DUF423 domain-containing protein [Archangiaceae bacterium]|nr:DUF423 domain-containing protein [Archangiaceae bacterium]